MTGASSGDPFERLNPGVPEVLDALSAEDWTALASLVARIQAHERSFGERIPPRQIAENRVVMGYSVTGELVDEVYKFLYAQGLVLAGFEWVNWEDGRALLNGENSPSISDLTVEETLGLITSIVRGDRFSEGALLSAFDSGTMPKLLARLLDFAGTAKDR